MTYDQAVGFFGSQAALAKAMGVSSPSVYEWRNGIPVIRQYQIELATNGLLKADLPAHRGEGAEA